MIAADDLERLREQQRDARRERRGARRARAACELRIVVPDGASRWVSVRSVPLRAADGG